MPAPLKGVQLWISVYEVHVHIVTDTAVKNVMGPERMGPAPHHCQRFPRLQGCDVGNSECFASCSGFLQGKTANAVTLMTVTVVGDRHPLERLPGVAHSHITVKVGNRQSICVASFNKLGICL